MYYPAKVAADLGGSSAVNMLNVAASGDSTSRILSEGTSQVDLHYYPDFVHNIAIIWAGTNDFYLYGLTASQILQNISTWCLARRAMGFKTIVLTLHPEGRSPSYMAMRAEFNASLIANHDFCDAVADTTSEVRLDPTNPTYYTDDIHLTQAGYELIAPFVEAAIDSLIS